MKLKLGNSIALSMVAILFLSIMTILPVHAQQPTIYMTPSVNPPSPGPYVGFKWNVTVWVTGYTGVFSWQVSLLYDQVAGINCTRVWVADFDPAYIFVDAPGTTYPLTQLVTPSPQSTLIWNTTVVNIENPVSDALKWTDGKNKYNVQDYVANCSGKFGPCAFLRFGNKTSGTTTWCHIESVAGNLQVVMKQAGFIKVTDTLTTQSPVDPPPDPAKLAIFEFQITKKPEKLETLTTALNIKNKDTFLIVYIDSTREKIYKPATDGSYTWTWTAPPARVGVKIEAATGDADTVRIDSRQSPAKVTYLSSGIAPSNNVTVGVYLKEYNELWEVTNVTFCLCYNSTLLNVLSVVPNPLWTTFNNVTTEPLGQLNVTVKAPVPPPPSGDVLLVTVKFHVKYQGEALAIDTSPLDICAYEAYDHVVPIDLNLPHEGEVVIEGVNRVPVAVFTESASTVLTGDVIYFNASGSYDPDLDGTIVSFFWTFGDGTNATGITVNHAYADNGVYNVTLTVTDNYGATASTSANKTVLNRPPVASFTESATTVYTGEVVYFNASESYDSDGSIVSYFWDFGDGNTTTVTSSVITHSYMASGTYNVNLTVIDDEGLSSSDVKTVIVKTPEGIPLYAVVIMVLATIAIVAAIVIYYKRIRKYKSRTV